MKLFRSLALFSALALFAGCAARPAPAEPSPTMPPAALPAQEETPSPSAAPSPTPSAAAPSASPASSPSPKADLAPSTRMPYEKLVAYDESEEPAAPMPPAGTYSIEIDLTNRVMTVFDQSGAPVRQMLCTVGRRDTPTPKGTFTMGKQRERFGYFEKYECYAQYWSQIEGDIFIHSVLYEERDEDELIDSSYRNLGRASSHGCVRLTVPDARWIYENVAPGSTVTVLKKEKDEALRESLRLPKAQ